jgi:hypothetical protein
VSYAEEEGKTNLPETPKKGKQICRKHREHREHLKHRPIFSGVSCRKGLFLAFGV